MKLRGSIPVMMTPFRDDETIDEADLRKQVDFAIARGAAAVCAPGLGSEAYKLSDPERYWMAETVLDQTRKRKPTIISTGSGSIFNTIEFSRHAERLGADCLMVIPPRTAPLSIKELTLFYERVAGSVGIPIMIQDLDLTGSGIPASVYIDLAQRVKNLHFAKLENPLPGAKCAEIIRGTAGQVQVIFGLWGIYMADGMPRGAGAIMAGPGITEVYGRIISLFDEGKVEESRALLYRTLPYMAFCLQHLEAGIVLDKRMLKRRGVIQYDRLREPYLHLEQTNAEEMDGLIDLVLPLCDPVK
ncbi:MAG: dihydrodipicolinate synthase family protein [Candidatus Solibacter usitatus]|nr:dihydrodipicolinate synthase family protein [Candidatus Solibacter usitatus]